MEENPEKSGNIQESNRNEKGQFVKGQSGNPAGKPVGGGLSLTTILKNKLDSISKTHQKEFKEVFIDGLVDDAIIKNDFQAKKLIFNYIDGLPKQQIELSAVKKILIENE